MPEASDLPQLPDGWACSGSAAGNGCYHLLDRYGYPAMKLAGDRLVWASGVTLDEAAAGLAYFQALRRRGHAR